MRTYRMVLLATTSLVACSAGAQSLQGRIASAGDGPVQFNFASRDGVCGNGHSFFRVDDDGWYQTSSSSSFNTNDGMRSEQCVRGPVRVVITHAKPSHRRCWPIAPPCRRAISALTKFDDPRINDALKGLIEK